MTLERFKQIIEAYGTRPEHWPADEREAARHLAQDSSEAQAWLAQFSTLDDWLDTDLENGRDIDMAPLVGDLRARLLETLPPQNRPRRPLLDRFIEWLLPDAITPAEMFRPALLAAMPLIVGVIFSGSLTSAINLDNNDTDNYSWDDEVYLLSLTPDTSRVEGTSEPSPEVTP